jgi:peptidoglycan/LPS O-acetylase OafA/YrhL
VGDLQLKPGASHSHPSPRILFLDGWRGFSILAVLIGHFTHLAGMNYGRFGVEMFFVLSGRLMAQVLFIEKMPLGEFLRRRAARVWPALYLFVLVVYLVLYGTGITQYYHLIGIVTFTINYLPLYPDQPAVFNHLWSLSVEEWTYIFLAAAALAHRRLGVSPYILIGVPALACIAHGMILTLAGYDYYHVYWRTDVRAGSILVSVATFLWVHNRRRSMPSFVAPVAGMIGLLLNTNPSPDILKYSVGPFFLSLALATLGSSPRWMVSLFSLKPMALLGAISFSLYLWQQPFEVYWPQFGILRLLPAFALAILSFRFVEGPARRYLNSIGAPARPAAQGS